MTIEEKYCKMYDNILDLAKKLQEEADECYSILQARKKMGASDTDASILGIMKAKVEVTGRLIAILDAFK